MKIILNGNTGTGNLATALLLSHHDGGSAIATERMTGAQYQAVTEGLARVLAEMGFDATAQKIQEVAGVELRAFRARLEAELEKGIEQTTTTHVALKTAPVVP
ncbi:MAG: hypothetical protein ABW167_07805 [Baekduia sp.]